MNRPSSDLLLARIADSPREDVLVGRVIATQRRRGDGGASPRFALGDLVEFAAGCGTPLAVDDRVHRLLRSSDVRAVVAESAA
jgi:co-chaperonin GroES (HSP10)